MPHLKLEEVMTPNMLNIMNVVFKALVGRLASRLTTGGRASQLCVAKVATSARSSRFSYLS